MSQATIGNLRVDLGLNTAQFDAGAKKAQSSLAGLSGSIKGFAAGIAGALTLGGVAKFMQTSIERMDQIGEAAEKVGMSAEAFSRLEYAARVAGVGMDGLTTTLARFSRQIVEISQGGNNDAAQALQSLGISAVDVQGKLRPTEMIIADVAEAFGNMEDSAEKTALAIALFGRSGAAMIPFLNGGRKAINDLSAEAEAFGLVVDRESAQAAARFNDNLTRLQGASEGLQRQLARALVPALADVSEGLLDYVKRGDLIEKAVAGIKAEFSDLARTVTLTADGMDRLSQYWQMLDDLVRNYGPFSRNAQDGFYGLFPSSGKGDVPAGLLERALEKPSGVKASKGMLDGMLDSIDLDRSPRTGTTTHPLLIPQIPPGTIDDIYGAGEAIRTLSTEIETASNYTDNLARSISDGLASSLTDIAFNAKSAGEAMEMLKTSALDMLQSITDQLLRSGLGMLLQGPAVAPSQAGGGLLASVFGGFRADGGRVSPGKGYIVGERGPEWFQPDTAGRVHANGAGGGVKVNIINQTGAKVSTEAREMPDGTINIRALIQDEVIDTLGGGRAARVMGGRYGARIMPRRT
jgi:hypothetical protein